MSAAIAAIAASSALWRRTDERSIVRPSSSARHWSIARSTSFSTSRGECDGDPPSVVASTALMMAASSVGSHSSRYIATCASVTRRRSGQTKP
jgi:hypothetical protein